jgi:hypothetical protein
VNACIEREASEPPADAGGGRQNWCPLWLQTRRRHCAPMGGRVRTPGKRRERLRSAERSGGRVADPLRPREGEERPRTLGEAGEEKLAGFGPSPRHSGCTPGAAALCFMFCVFSAREHGGEGRSTPAARRLAVWRVEVTKSGCSSPGVTRQSARSLRKRCFFIFFEAGSLRTVGNRRCCCCKAPAVSVLASGGESATGCTLLAQRTSTRCRSRCG